MYNAIKDRIIVKLFDDNNSLIIQPNRLQPKNQGVVLSVGSEVNSVVPGDKIIFHPYDEIALPRENLVVIREKSLLALITNDC